MDAIRNPSPHVLLIDGNPSDLRLLAGSIQSAGYRLTMVLGGSGGYDRAMVARPDVILLDLQASAPGGLAILRLLKANPSTEGIPVILLSALDALDERLAGLREGAVDCVNRPFVAEEVLLRVRIHLKLAVRQSIREVEGDARDVDPASASADEVLVVAARNYLSERLAAPPKLDVLARVVGSNERRLTAAFSRHLGMTVFTYIRQARMEKAGDLLANTSSSVASIAEELGFSSAANFATAFREHAGESPSAYRASRR
nr:helix-turn-helix domain-containing protein [Paraburkholderia unamae]